LELRQRDPKRYVSMSTSLMYHALGIRGYGSVRTEYPHGQVIFTIAQYPRDCRWPACGTYGVVSCGHAKRRLRRVGPIFRKRDIRIEIRNPLGVELVMSLDPSALPHCLNIRP
jgi:hypothetical protein